MCLFPGMNMVPLQTNNHREKGWQWLPDPPLLYLDAEKKERDRRQERLDSYTHCSPHLQTRGAARMREKIMTVFPKRLQKEMFQGRKKQTKTFPCKWWLWITWKPTGPLTMSPGRGPQWIASWKSVTVPGKEHTHEWLDIRMPGAQFHLKPREKGKQ